MNKTIIVERREMSQQMRDAIAAAIRLDRAYRKRQERMFWLAAVFVVIGTTAFTAMMVYFGAI